MAGRLKWKRHQDFLFTCLGFGVGLSNVWRFPYLCYKYGGGAFFIPYFVSLFVIGIPVFFLEVAFGQFASRGVIPIWEINPFFKGLGYTMVFASGYISIYYSVIVSQCVYFMFASLQSSLPWASCGNYWNTCNCRTPKMSVQLNDTSLWNSSNGLNCSGIKFTSSQLKQSTAEYYYLKVLMISSGIEKPGELRPDLALCHLFVWVLVFLSIIQGVRSLGKVAYIFAICPYILMTALLIRAASLPGAPKGISFYMSFDVSKMMTSEAWKEAGSQILFSLSCCTGGLMTLSSYNKFNSNCVRDSFVVPVINFISSFWFGLLVFAVFGFFADVMGKDISGVATSGRELVFIAYPTALAEMPVPQLWSFLFFLMLVLLGMGSLLPFIETFVTAFQDEFVELKHQDYNIWFRLSVCFSAYLLGMPQTTQGGMYILEVCDSFLWFPTLFMGLLQNIIILWIYGPKRFEEDIMLMVGYSYRNRILFGSYIKWSLIVSTPLFFMITIFSQVEEYKPITDKGYPQWAEWFGWLIVIFLVMWTPIWFFASLCSQEGFKPTIYWGPADPKDRTIPRYQSRPDSEKKIQDKMEPMAAFDIVPSTSMEPSCQSESTPV